MITVVMPTFNQGKFLRAAMDSILGQSFREFELVVVNDASTDLTDRILAEYVSKDDRIRLITLDKNGGTGTALNAGFAQARGELETWWASDNIMYPSCLAILHRFLVEHPAVEFVYGNCEIGVMDDTGLVERKRKNIRDEVGSQEWDIRRFLASYHLGICWLWRKELRLRAGGTFQRQPCEDYDMTLRMAAARGVFEHTPETMGWFRRHSANMTNRIHGTHQSPTTTDTAKKWAILTQGA